MDAPYPLLYVVWVDCQDSLSSWKVLSEIEEWYEDDWAVEQTGWLYEETENYLVLLNMVCEDFDQVSHVTKIPKPWLLHREELKIKQWQKSVKKKDVKTKPSVAGSVGGIKR